MEKYCVFWYPTPHYLSLNARLKRFKVETIVSDFGVDVCKLQVSIESSKYLDESGVINLEAAKKDPGLIENSLHFSVFDKSGRLIFDKFTLKHENHSSNGMVVYEYQIPDNYPAEAPSFEECLVTVFYHCAKSLFHDHEVQSDRDSGLRGWISASSDFKPESIKEKDNPCLRFYLEQYEKILYNYAEEASQRIRERDAVIMKFEGRISPRDKKGGYFGYEDLLRYGKREFVRWYKDIDHQSELRQLQTDVLIWQLNIYPHFERPKKELKNYVDRFKLVKRWLLSKVKADPEDETVVKYSMVEKCNSIRLKLLAWRKDESQWSLATKREVYTVDYLLRQCEVVIKSSNNLIGTRKLFKLLRKVWIDLPKLTEDTRKEASRLCEGALTEYVYCKTLLESRYNTLVSHDRRDGEQLDEKMIEGRRQACNIRNSIRYIETVKYRCTNAQYNSLNMFQRKADQLNKYAMFWTITNIILAVAGVIVAFC